MSKKFPLRQAACCADWCKEDIIKPKEHGCGGEGQTPCFNIDTGLCNYNEEYCAYMGFNETEEGNMLCDGEGCEASTYTKCKLSEGQDISSYVIPEIVVKEWARNPVAVVAGAAATAGTVALVAVTAPVSIPGAIAATGIGATVATGAAVGASAAVCSLTD